MLNEVFAVNMTQQDDFKLAGSDTEHVSSRCRVPPPPPTYAQYQQSYHPAHGLITAECNHSPQRTPPRPRRRPPGAQPAGPTSSSSSGPTSAAAPIRPAAMKKIKILSSDTHIRNRLADGWRDRDEAVGRGWEFEESNGQG